LPRRDSRKYCDEQCVLCPLRGSGQDVAYDSAMNIGQAEIAAAVVVGESLVIQTEQMENRGMEIMDVDAVFDGMHA